MRIRRLVKTVLIQTVQLVPPLKVPVLLVKQDLQGPPAVLRIVIAAVLIHMDVMIVQMGTDI